MSSISPVYARFVLRELLQRGLPEDPLFSGTSLNREELETGGSVSMKDFTTFLNNAREQSGDEQLGLLIGKHTNVITLGPVGAAVATAPTVREGLQVLENFARLHASYMQVELRSTMAGLSVHFGFLEDAGKVARFHEETAVMLVQHYIETLTGRTLDDAQYRFGFETPGYVSEYPSYLHSPVSFAHDNTSVEVPRHWLDLCSPYYNPEIWNQAQLLLAQRLRELGDDSKNPYTQHLTALLRSCEPPLPDLGTVAARLHVSDRTLNRRLKEEGTSFRQLKAQTLGAWARRYLKESEYSVEAIAATLGYQDAANFRRAFRVLEGCSPIEFRQQA